MRSVGRVTGGAASGRGDLCVAWWNGKIEIRFRKKFRSPKVPRSRRREAATRTGESPAHIRNLKIKNRPTVCTPARVCMCMHCAAAIYFFVIFISNRSHRNNSGEWERWATNTPFSPVRRNAHTTPHPPSDTNLYKQKNSHAYNVFSN